VKCRNGLMAWLGLLVLAVISVKPVSAQDQTWGPTVSERMAETTRLRAEDFPTDLPQEVAVARAFLDSPKDLSQVPADRLVLAERIFEVCSGVRSRAVPTLAMARALVDCSCLAVQQASAPEEAYDPVVDNFLLSGEVEVSNVSSDYARCYDMNNVYVRVIEEQLLQAYSGRTSAYFAVCVADNIVAKHAERKATPGARMLNYSELRRIRRSAHRTCRLSRADGSLKAVVDANAETRREWLAPSLEFAVSE